MTEVKNNRENEKNKKIITLLIVFILICLICALCFSCGYNKKKVLRPDYAPQDVEVNLEDIEDDTDIKLTAPDGGGAVSIQYTKDVNIDLSDKKAYLNYKNPGKSTHDIVLQIVVQNEVIAQSGLIPPGNMLKELDLLNDSGVVLSEGAYENAKFIFLCYNPESGEKAIVDAEAMIVINVTD